MKLGTSRLQGQLLDNTKTLIRQAFLSILCAKKDESYQIVREASRFGQYDR